MKLGLNTISAWFGVIMILIVVTLAVAIGFTDLLIESLYGTKRVFFVILLLAYAVYRGFRLHQLINRAKYED